MERIKRQSAMARKRTVSIDTLEQAKRELAELPPKPMQEKCVDTALEEMKPLIQALLKKGYSRADVCEHLYRLGIPAKEYQLKALLSKKRASAKERQA
ncbi:hypothetical protein LBW59_16725 [Ralstonia solanacearum]|uniref:Regulatory protein RecX n=1 Tax=Ralstonia solanacearum TaxID=305 RepID=A0AAW5ZQN0_RALSL|nr:hypothetical protein [Ralstonia solanacearum]MDB0572407.1 hypothetical protein [Ralstonia solanacearum]